MFTDEDFCCQASDVPRTRRLLRHRGQRDDPGPTDREGPGEVDTAVPAGHHREAGREGRKCDGARSDLRARPEGFAASQHRPGVRLRLEGEYEHAMDNESVKTYKAGETFYEPSGVVHRVAQNPSGKTRTRLLAVILHPRDAKEVTVREKGK